MVSLYFHIPFCKKKCGYCHFYVTSDKEPFKTVLMQGFEVEWKKAAPLLKEKKICSIYFGGGTPYLLGPDRLSTLLSSIRREPSCEITLEANPEDVTLETLQAYKEAGVNRLSLGVQSLNDQELFSLTRNHSAKKAREAVYKAKEAGIVNLSIDLMYDIPGQTLKSWQATVEETLTLPLTHLSLYNLTFEPHTAFFKHQKKISPTIPSDEISAEMYAYARERFQQGNLFQYEISAFAREGFRSIHNSGYWTARPFLGFGPSAFSYWEGRRFRNVPHLHQWLQALQQDRSPIDFEEELPPAAQKRELLAIRLRMLDGVESDQLDEITWPIIDKLCHEGYLEKCGHRIKLTDKGILFYDAVATEVI